MGTVQIRTALVTVTLGLVIVGATGCGGQDDAAPPTTEAVTLTTEVDADPVVVGEQILVAAGARDAVVPGEGAEERLVELGSNWCTTALRSDVANADATFRYSLNDFFTEWGLVSAAGEVQDVPLGRAMLVGNYAEPLAQASNEVLCPEVGGD